MKGDYVTGGATIRKDGTVSSEAGLLLQEQVSLKGSSLAQVPVTSCAAM